MGQVDVDLNPGRHRVQAAPEEWLRVLNIKMVRDNADGLAPQVASLLHRHGISTSVTLPSARTAFTVQLQQPAREWVANGVQAPQALPPALDRARAIIDFMGYIHA